MRTPQASASLSILALVLLASLEHVQPAPARLLVAADSVVVNGPAPFLLAVAAVDARGDTLSPVSLSYRASANGVVELPHQGQARCRRQGDATVVANLAGITARMAIVCRPIATFGFPTFIRLVIGGDPVLPTFIAYDSNGARITDLAGTAHIRDSSVVRYAGGLLRPVGVGGTYLDADFTGMKTRQPILVVRRLVSERLALAGGEIRTWLLPPGRSELFLVSDSTNPAATRLVLGAFNANCARGPRRAGEQHWFCISRPGSKAVVKDTRRVGTRGAVRADFSMFAIP